MTITLIRNGSKESDEMEKMCDTIMKDYHDIELIKFDSAHFHYNDYELPLCIFTGNDLSEYVSHGVISYLKFRTIIDIVKI